MAKNFGWEDPWLTPSGGAWRKSVEVQYAPTELFDALRGLRSELAPLSGAWSVLSQIDRLLPLLNTSLNLNVVHKTRSLLEQAKQLLNGRGASVERARLFLRAAEAEQDYLEAAARLFVDVD